MKLAIFSYRFAQEILQHANYSNAWLEIETIVKDAPLFVYPRKSQKNKQLDVVQQVLNTYFDRVFVLGARWDNHPLATGIKDSALRADFRKAFGNLRIQTEVQFGNMARWYTDVFKFQTAYSQSLINIGLSIVPMWELAKRIDSNIVNFERAKRELPSADLSITLPILMIGVTQDKETAEVDVSRCQFASIREITGKGKLENRKRIVNGYLNRVPMNQIGPTSDIGPAFDVFEEDEDLEATP